MIENPGFYANTIGEARAILRNRLENTLEVDCLLCAVLNCDRSYLYTQQRATISRADKRRLETLLQRRLQGTPLAYLIGNCEFFSLELEIRPGVLIPRPSTETLVETALVTMQRQARVLDLGTGCGCVAIALARRRPDVTVTACDINADALALARQNAKRHNVRINFIESDWFAGLPDRHVDLIVANPPYVDKHDPELEPEVLAHEPRSALFAGERGLACLRRIVTDAPEHLHHGGALALEHGYTQAIEVDRMMAAAGIVESGCTPDLAGHPRVTMGFKA